LSSSNTRKKFSDMCNHRNTKIVTFGTKELLGKFTGKQMRVVLCIIDKSFADRLSELIETNS